MKLIQINVISLIGEEKQHKYDSYGMTSVESFNGS
jgi:hypothetical protein